MLSKIGLVLALVFIAPQAWGRAGVGAAAGGLKNENSLNGMCTTENSGQRWVAQGWCRSITETLSSGCGGQKLEEIRNTVINDGIEGIQDYCPNITSFATDREQFTQFMTQLMAVLAIEESDWRTGVTSSMGAQGIMQLSYGSVKQKPYSCGCSAIRNANDVRNDHHKNVRCGSYIALHWIAKDKAIGKGSGNKGSRGIARYFQPFRDIDKKKRQRMQNKMKFYCQQRGSGAASPVTSGSGASPATN